MTPSNSRRRAAGSLLEGVGLGFSIEAFLLLPRIGKNRPSIFVFSGTNVK